MIKLIPKIVEGIAKIISNNQSKDILIFEFWFAEKLATVKPIKTIISAAIKAKPIELPKVGANNLKAWIILLNPPLNDWINKTIKGKTTVTKKYVKRKFKLYFFLLYNLLLVPLLPIDKKGASAICFRSANKSEIQSNMSRADCKIAKEWL